MLQDVEESYSSPIESKYLSWRRLIGRYMVRDNHRRDRLSLIEKQTSINKFSTIKTENLKVS